MPTRVIVRTDEAPSAIGPYSQAVKVGATVYMSGQIPLDPKSMSLVEGEFRVQAKQVFTNLEAVARAAGGSLQDAVKLNCFLTDLANFAILNEVMSEFIKEPFPARAAIGVASLPKDAQVEIDAVLELSA